MLATCLLAALLMVRLAIGPVGGKGKDSSVPLTRRGIVPVWAKVPAEEQAESQMLIVDGGGETYFSNALAGQYLRFSPAPGEHLHDSMDLYDGHIAMPMDLENEKGWWTRGRLLWSYRGTLWLIDLARAGEPDSGRRWFSGKGSVLHCRWQEDGQWASFSRFTSSGPEVWLVESSSGRAHPVRGLDGCFDPILSRDGRYFACAKDGDLWISRRDGSSMRRLGLAGARWPAWSPDGTRLAYQQWQDGQWDIWVFDLNTGRKVRLTKHPSWDVYPAWGEVENQIAFGTSRSGHWEIWGVPGP
jgi:hypothetical protein